MFGEAKETLFNSRLFIYMGGGGGGGGGGTVIILCISYNQDSTIAQGGEKGPRATRFKMYRKYTIAWAWQGQKIYKTVQEGQYKM